MCTTLSAPGAGRYPENYRSWVYDAWEGLRAPPPLRGSLSPVGARDAKHGW